MEIELGFEITAEFGENYKAALQDLRTSVDITSRNLVSM